MKLRIDPLAVNTQGAAEALGCSEALLRKMRLEGNGPGFMRVNRKVVYPVDELKRYLTEEMKKTMGR